MNELKEQATSSLQAQPANKELKPIDRFRTTIEKYVPELEKALPKHIDARRMARICLTTVQKTPKLLECTPQSLFGCIIQAAQLGLEIDSGLGHAWLIPFKSECQLIIGYQGMIELGYRSGLIKSLNAAIVYPNDVFEFQQGTKPFLKHIPNIDNYGEGEYKCVYAVAELSNKGSMFIVLPHKKITEAMAKSMSKGNYGPWKEYPEEMIIKTAFRRLFKRLPKSPQIQTALALDGLAENNLLQGLNSDTLLKEGELQINDFTDIETLE